MPVSIFDIDVNDSKFAAFQKSFQKYSDMLGKMPGGWSKVEKSTEGVVDNFGKMTAALMAQQELLHKQQGEHDKIAKAANTAQRGMSSLVRDTKDVAKNIGSATLSLLKWAGITSILGGLMGAGGLWGIDRLAMSASASRRSAGGLGISTGENEAFGINYRRFVDPDSMLGNVNHARSDMNSRWAFGAMGIQGEESKNPTQLAVEIIESARKLWLTSDKSMQTMSANGLDKFMTFEDWKRIGNTSREELDRQNRKYNEDKSSLNMDPGRQQKWQDLEDQFTRAGTLIKNVLIDGLTPLAEPIERLSKAFSEAIAAFMKSDAAKEAIAWLSKELNDFAGWVGSPAFKQDMKDFQQGFENFLTGLKRVYDWIVSWIPEAGPKKGEWGGTLPKSLFDGFGSDISAGTLGRLPWLMNPVTGGTTIVPDVKLPPVNPTTSSTGSGGGFLHNFGVMLTEDARRLLGPSGLGFRQTGIDADTGKAMNNPANLTSSPTQAGTSRVKMADGSFRTFANFSTVDDGIQALGEQLLRYQHNWHKQNIEDILETYAPKSDNNDTSKTLASVIDKLNLGAGADGKHLINLDDNKNLSVLMSAILKQENRGWTDFTSDKVLVTINNNTSASAVVQTNSAAAGAR